MPCVLKAPSWKFSFQITLKAVYKLLSKPQESVPGTLFVFGNFNRLLSVLAWIPINPSPHVIYFSQPVPQPCAIDLCMVCEKGVRRTPTRVLQKDRERARAYLTNRSTCPITPPTPLQKSWALITDGAAKLHKREGQLRHKAALGAGPPSAVGVFPPSTASFWSSRRLGPISSGRRRGRCCPTPSTPQARAPSDLPTSLSAPRKRRSVEHFFRGCAIRVITCHWVSSHVAFPGL